MWEDSIYSSKKEEVDRKVFGKFAQLLGRGQPDGSDDNSPRVCELTFYRMSYMAGGR